MSVSAISALSAPSNSSASTGVAQDQHKHGVHSLKGSFAIAAGNALGAMGTVAVNAATGSASHMVMTALNSLKVS
jgi:hypothetical protein